MEKLKILLAALIIILFNSCVNLGGENDNLTDILSIEKDEDPDQGIEDPDDREQ